MSQFSEFEYVDLKIIAKLIFWSFVLTIVVTFFTMQHTINGYKQEKLEREKAAKQEHLDNATTQSVESVNSTEDLQTSREIAEMELDNHFMKDVIDEESPTAPPGYIE